MAWKINLTWKKIHFMKFNLKIFLINPNFSGFYSDTKDYNHDQFTAEKKERLARLRHLFDGEQHFAHQGYDRLQGNIKEITIGYFKSIEDAKLFYQDLIIDSPAKIASTNFDLQNGIYAKSTIQSNDVDYVVLTDCQNSICIKYGGTCAVTSVCPASRVNDKN